MKDFTGISEERRKIEQWAKLFETASERIRISQALIQTSEELLQASTEPLQLSEACMRTSLEVIQKARARIIETRDRFTGADQREGSN